MEHTLCVLGSLAYRKELSILQAISHHICDFNHTTLLLHCGDNVDMVLSSLDLTRQVHVVNLVLCGISLPADVYKVTLDKMEKQSCRVVLILTNCPADIIHSHSNAYAITWSYHDLAYRATNMLIQAGHTRIGTVHLEKYRDRWLGYLHAMKHAGIALDPSRIVEAGQLVSDTSIVDSDIMRRIQHFVLETDSTAVFAPTELLTLAIPIQIYKNQNKLQHVISVYGMAYPGWIGEGFNFPVGYIRYPIESVVQKALAILFQKPMTGSDSPESRHIDLTAFAAAVEPAPNPH